MGLGQEFDRVINLSEVVESTLLTSPGRRTHALPLKARQNLCNVNYIDFHHQIAEVEGVHEAKFHTKPNEVTKVEKWKENLTGPVVHWALAGSSVHKTWPHVAIAVMYLLRHTNANVVFTGGPAEQQLEHGILQQLLWELDGVTYEHSHEMKISELLTRLGKHYPKRVWCTSGQWSVRESLTHAVLADIVVGPETGVLNAVAYEPDVHKVVLLSHSSHENLTRDWENTTVIAPIGVSCYPCHRLHFGREFCPEDKETAASVCAASITPKRVFEAILAVFEERKVA